MTKLSKLTDFETGEPLFLDLSTVVAIKRLPASVHDYLNTGTPTELGGRTKIQTAYGIHLVRESPVEVADLLNELTRQVIGSGGGE